MVRTAIPLAFLLLLLHPSCLAESSSPIVEQLTPPLPKLRGAVQSFGGTGGHSAVKLFGGLYEYRYGKPLILLPQQGQFDPSTKTSIIELAQHKPRPLVSNATVGEFLPLPELPSPQDLSSAPSVNSFTNPRLLPLPQTPMVPLFDPGYLRRQSAAFDERCQESLFSLPADFAQLNQHFEESLFEVRKLAAESRSKLDDQTLLADPKIDAARTRMAELRERAAQKLAELRIKNETGAEDRTREVLSLAARGEELRAKMLADMEQNSTALSGRLSVPTSNSADASGLLLDPPSADNRTADDALSWDAWYSRVADAVKGPLLDAINRNGSPAGQDTVRITVWKDLRIKVELESGSNQAFDSAVIDAYKALEFSPALEFPRGSKRSVVTYTTDHRHEENGTAIDIDAHKLTGDVEFLH